MDSKRPLRTADLKPYYSRRAAEYEAVYDKPERQSDIALLTDDLRQIFAGRDVLEIACGTGFWTRKIAPVVRSITAVDISLAVLDLARQRNNVPDRVRFVCADAFDLASVDGTFTAALAGFWWSHVERDRHDPFLRQLGSRLEPGAPIVMMDNRFVPGSSTPISYTDHRGDTFQDRRLADGSVHRVLKNFPDRATLVTTLEPHAYDRELPAAEPVSESDPKVDVLETTYFWRTVHHARGAG